LTYIPKNAAQLCVKQRQAGACRFDALFDSLSVQKDYNFEKNFVDISCGNVVLFSG